MEKSKFLQLCAKIVSKTGIGTDSVYLLSDLQMNNNIGGFNPPANSDCSNEGCSNSSCSWSDNPTNNACVNRTCPQGGGMDNPSCSNTTCPKT